MSLILEALRKSEAERRRGNAPDVAMELPPAPLRTRSTAPAWLWPVVLLAFACAALAWWLATKREVAAPSASTIATAEADTALPAVAPAVVSRPVAPPVAETPVVATVPPPSETVAAPVAASAPPSPTPARDIPPPQAPILPPPAPVPAASSMSGVKLSMHMWDASADKRFVILNGQRMGEGDRNGDVQVVAIERDGVVVERDGQRARVALP